MAHDYAFKAREAGEITGVPPDVQRDWRRRGIIADSTGSQARYTLQGLAALRLTRAFCDAGSPLAAAARYAEVFKANLAEATFANLRRLPLEHDQLAVVAFVGGKAVPFVCDNFGQVDEQLAGGTLSFLLAVALGPLAGEMADRVEWADVEGGIADLDEEMTTRGL